MKSGYWLVIGLVAGLGLGLLVGWVLVPVQYYDTDPSALHPAYRDEYLHLVARTYAVDHQLNAAQTRLRRLEATTPSAPLCELTARLIATDAPTTTITPLAWLAHDLNAATPPMAPYLTGRQP
ncbi:MAG: hypothetical protein U9Q70_05445 [Chloroflexota bacterium]|nr:hypothetical protein [Chloroflexota bacterium]